MTDIRGQSASEKRREKARNLRFKRPACKALNWQSITEDLWDMQSDISDVQWMAEDEAVVLDALDGDEDEAFEFRIAFSDLAGECERMQEDMDELRRIQSLAFCSPENADVNEPPELFDLFFPAIDAEDELMGYDSFEGDYFGLDYFTCEAAVREAKKRLMRLTKDQLIDLSGLCLRIARQYLALRYRYDCLRTAIDVLMAQNDRALKVVRNIEALYEDAERASDGFKYAYMPEIRALDRAIGQLPERLWIE